MPVVNFSILIVLLLIAIRRQSSVKLASESIAGIAFMVSTMWPEMNRAEDLFIKTLYCDIHIRIARRSSFFALAIDIRHCEGASARAKKKKHITSKTCWYFRIHYHRISRPTITFIWTRISRRSENQRNEIVLFKPAETHPAKPESQSQSKRAAVCLCLARNRRRRRWRRRRSADMNINLFQFFLVALVVNWRMGSALSNQIEIVIRPNEEYAN